MDIVALNEKIKNESAFIDLLMSEIGKVIVGQKVMVESCLLYTSPSPRDRTRSRMPSSA